MEKSTGRTIRLGILVTVGAILFTIAIYLIGQKQDMFSNTFRLRAYFNNVNGLQQGNNVRFSGINIGSVLAVNIQNDSSIEVIMRIKEDVRKFIKKNALVSIGTDGLMGNMLINISPGLGDAAIVNNNDELISYSRVKTDDILKTLNMTNENAAILTSGLLEIVENIRYGKGTLSSILYDTALSENLSVSIRNLKDATTKTNQILSDITYMTNQIKDGKGLAGYFLTDSIASKDINQTVKELKKASANIRESTDSLQQFISKVNSGKGTVNTLLSDSIVAKEFKQTITNLNKGTKKFDESMDGLKHSFILRRYFKKVDKKTK